MYITIFVGEDDSLQSKLYIFVALSTTETYPGPTLMQ